MGDGVLTLYQAEWCPFSSAVREVLTELGLDFVARQVEPWPSQRHSLRELSGTDQIPTLQTEDGRFLVGTRAIFSHLRERDPWRFEAAHRRRFVHHREARVSEVPAELLEHFRGTGELEAAEGSPADADIGDAPAASRFELRLDGRLIGIAAYRRRNGSIVFTHTVIDESCQGRGFASALTEAALQSAAREGAEVVPLCSFTAAYIDRHPEFEPLVASSYRDRS